jgi:hypothetical protein
MKVTVTPTRNGAYVEYDDGENVDRASYTFDKDESLEGAQECFYDIAEWIGLVGGRYDRNRLSIRIIHGDKHECSGCKICSQEA